MFLLLLVLCQSGLHYSLSRSRSLSLSLQGKTEKGGFFSPLPFSSQALSPVAPLASAVSYGMFGENATPGPPFEMIYLFSWIQSGVCV